MGEARSEIEVLSEISSAVLREKNVERLLELVLDILSREMGMLRATFTLREGDHYQIEASRGLDEAEKRRGRYHPGEGITGTVAASGRPALVKDISKDKNFLNRTGSHKAGERAAFLCVPIRHHEQIVGTLSIERNGGPGVDLESDLKLLEVIGNLTAEAVAVRKQEFEERETLETENRRLREAIHRSANPGQIIGNCRNMQPIYQLIRQVAPTDATVLIRGNSGTGKELVALAIRQLSHRREGPFVTLNCAALPDTLIESELFGHEKGAFTGAQTRRTGRVEAADGGTLFLDEIGDLSPTSQVKVLRFLQERTYSLVGSNEEKRSDVRIIAATSRNLEELIEKGEYREDLYYRLNVFPIQLPDLAHRRCDILLLAEHFIAKYNLRHGKTVKRLSTPAINMLMAYHWPGNVRELENCIERAVLTASGEVILGHNLPPSLQTASSSGTGLIPDESGDFKTLVDSFQRELIVEALKKEHGNMSAAARSLKLSPRMMHYKINRLGVNPDDFAK